MISSSSSSSSAANTASSTASEPSKKGPTCKICCACPQERRRRDECTIFKDFEDCKEEIEAFYTCLLKEGFSDEDVAKLRKNTRR
jgi:cytochrome c oxidase assembly protein subunit 17